MLLMHASTRAASRQRARWRGRATPVSFAPKNLLSARHTRGRGLQALATSVLTVRDPTLVYFSHVYPAARAVGALCVPAGGCARPPSTSFCTRGVAAVQTRRRSSSTKKEECSVVNENVRGLTRRAWGVRGGLASFTRAFARANGVGLETQRTTAAWLLEPKRNKIEHASRDGDDLYTQQRRATRHRCTRAQA